MEVLAGRVAIDDLDAFVADLDAVGQRHDVTVQAFDARYVAGRGHLERAVELADRAIARGENVARDRAVEILLYAAGRRQIDRAFEMGVSEGENEVVVLVDAPDAGEAATPGTDAPVERETAASEDLAATFDLEPATTLDRRDEDTLCAYFEITDVEREATDAPLSALVRERVALLDVEK